MCLWTLSFVKLPFALVCCGFLERQCEFATSLGGTCFSENAIEKLACWKKHSYLSLMLHASTLSLLRATRAFREEC